MTLYYKIVFSILASEIAALTFLIGPLPHTVRRAIANLSSNTGVVVSSLAYAIKIALLIDMVFFVDTVNRLRVITANAALAGAESPGQIHDVATQTSFHARKS
jgi:hypothetical protein